MTTKQALEIMMLMYPGKTCSCYHHEWWHAHTLKPATTYHCSIHELPIGGEGCVIFDGKTWEEMLAKLVEFKKTLHVEDKK